MDQGDVGATLASLITPLCDGKMGQMNLNVPFFLVLGDFVTLRDTGGKRGADRVDPKLCYSLLS